MHNKVGVYVKDQSQMVRGILEGCILKIIGDGETYGYEIVERLRELGFKDINEGTVYPLLIRIEKNNWVTHIKRYSPQGPKRKYFILTPEGEAEVQAFKDNWSQLQHTVNKILYKTEDPQ